MNTMTDRDDVLDAFSVERTHDSATLQKYLQRYPQFAEDLLDLSMLIQNCVETDAAMTEHDRNRIQSAWSQMQGVRVPSGDNNVSARLKSESARLSRRFGVPRQVITALRECTVDPYSVPRGFASDLADEVGVSPGVLLQALGGVQTVASRSFRSDRAPQPRSRASFRKILEDAQVPAERIAELFAGE